jgi:phosphoglycerate dehydrogenase-like enzyme
VALAPSPGSQRLTDVVQGNGGYLVPLGQADVLIWEEHSADGFAPALAAAPRLQWVQLPSAGIEWLFELDLFRPDITWTCAKGAFSDAVAEMAITLLLAGFRELHTFARATTWLPERGRSLAGANVVIVGGGGIATALLGRLAPFGVRPTVVRRRVEPIDGARVVGIDSLDAVLPTADAVVLAVPLTPRTRHLIGAGQLARMRPDAWLINVGRGGLVDTGELVAALDAGRLGGAGLDVTDPEPLPDGHPLWGMPNVIITPHCASTLEMGAEPFAERVSENLRRWKAGLPLLGLVDTDAGF